MPDVRQPDVVTVAVSRVDGGLTVVRVVVTEYRPTTPEERAAGLGERIANWTKPPTPERIEAVLAKHGWTGGLAPVSWRLVPNDYVDHQTDRAYRGAWTDDGSAKPGHDMPKAREIHREKLRRLRAPQLEALDVEYQKADEANDQAAKRAVGQRKQVLRDLTADPAIDAAQTIAALKVAGLDQV